ncbi:MAG: hypothetical protein EAS48_06170, partial [Chryseobacterium sp.]
YDGGVFEKNEDGILYSNIFTEVNKNLVLQDKDFFLKEKNYFYLGNAFMQPRTNDINKAFERLKPNFPTTHPETGTDYYHDLQAEQYIEEVNIFYEFIVAGKEIAIIREKEERSVRRITMKKQNDGVWIGKPSIVKKNSSSLSFSDHQNLNLSSTDFKIFSNRKDSFFVKNVRGEQFVVSQNKLFPIRKDEVFLKFVGKSKRHFITERKIRDQDFHQVYDLRTPEKPIAENINILNLEYIDFHDGFWCLNHSNMRLLHQGERVEETDHRWGFYSFAENRIIHSKSYKRTDRLIIKKDVAYYNDVISNPFSGKEYGQVLGEKKFISAKFSKVIVSRDGALYLGKFNFKEKIYDYEKLDIEIEKYNESFLSPDGKYLVLSKEIGNYELFDINSNQKTIFFTGNFLEFTTDGKLIYEEDGSRIARIIDPVTLQEIIPQNYKYYRFHSPDGTFHASLAKFSKQKSLITGEYLSDEDLKKYPSSGSFQFFPGKEDDERRENLYCKNKKYFHNLGIYKPQEIRKKHILK